MRRLALLLLLAPLLVRCGEDEGDRCFYDEDCAATEFCEGAVPPGCDSDGEEGTCRPLLREGEECGTTSVDCVDGLICHGAYEPPICKPPSPVGGPCLDEGHCERGTRPTLDDPGLVCDRRSSPGVCVEAGTLPAGAPCWVSRACSLPGACVDGVCRGPGAEGERCQPYDLPGGRQACLEGLYCTAEQVCARALQEGERCWPGGTRCAEGLFCYSQTSACQAPLAAGDTCVSGDKCAEGLFCSSRAVCSGPLGEGESCWGADRCADGLFCYSRESVCHAPLETGAPCQPGRDECQAELFCYSRDLACRPPLADGEPCDPYADVCATGLRCDYAEDVCVPTR